MVFPLDFSIDPKGSLSFIQAQTVVHSYNELKFDFTIITSVAEGIMLIDHFYAFIVHNLVTQIREADWLARSMCVIIMG